MKQIRSKIEKQGHVEVKDFNFLLMRKILIEEYNLKEEEISINNFVS